ncbi:MAG: M16 family metallopeptidase [Planctomycetota bacterium]|jgi:predicted Zn-dependent peptidase
MRTRLAMLTLFSLALAGPALAQQVAVESFVLENGMEFLLVPRRDQPNSIAAGWLARVGSVNERPGITGISHFFEHMMFKGTRTIGTSDAEADARLRTEQEQIKRRLHELIWNTQYERFSRGEIDDPWDATHDTEEIRALRQRLDALIAEHADLIVNNEFDKIYTKLGASGMNAFTSEDVTFFFITVPSNKFELWAWMESDRLGDSVFREFYAERDVVHEERRLRTESTPTGIFQEQFDALFWQSSPYSWPVIGWPSDLNSYTLEAAQRYFDVYYRPNNLVGVIVGDFDPEAVKPVIESYFSRLERGEIEPPPVVTIEIDQLAEKRMEAECDCQPQIEVRYHTVPHDHADGFALEMMAAVLNGRTGRLYKGLVEDRAIAASAAAGTNHMHYGGSFSFRADVKGDATPEQLEQAWYEELARLQEEPVSEYELQKVKNQQAANAYRRLESNFFLLIQLGYFEALGGWEYINESPAKLQAVSAADIQRVANAYFEKTNRNVAIYRRAAGSAPEEVDPDLALVPQEIRQQVKQQAQRLTSMTDLAMLQQVMAQMQSMDASSLPPGQQAAMAYMQKKLRDRIAELEAAAGEESPQT